MFVTFTVSLLWADDAGRGEVVKSRFDRAVLDGQCSELTDGYLVDLHELLEMDLELIIETGSVARAICEGLPPLLHRHHLLELVDGPRERFFRHGLNAHKLTFSISLPLPPPPLLRLHVKQQGQRT